MTIPTFVVWAMFQSACTGMTTPLLSIYAAAQNEDAQAARVLASNLMIFGGARNETYLGCLTCSESPSDSVHNEYGIYGSEYGTNSIFNAYSQFGSPYSEYSACNPYASDPPVIVDVDGEFYGRLTVNEYHRDALHLPELSAWLQGVCR